MASSSFSTNKSSRFGFILDLLIYISVMFLIREISIPNVHFLVTAILWTLTCLLIASWRMKVRGITWKDLGFKKPESIKKTIVATIIILIAVPICLIIFNMISDQLSLFSGTTSGGETSSSRFGFLQNNWGLFIAIMPIVLLESFLEELLDRGFLIHWFEKVFSGTHFATFLAVIVQALIFGFRHSYDLSERSITVGIIGLIMGIVYVKSGRNLWPLIIAHCILNTISMVNRV